MTDDLNEPADVHWAQMTGFLIIILLLFLILLVATGDPRLLECRPSGCQPVSFPHNLSMLAAWEMGQYRLAPCTVSSLRAHPVGWAFLRDDRRAPVQGRAIKRHRRGSRPRRQHADRQRRLSAGSASVAGGPDRVPPTGCPGSWAACSALGLWVVDAS
jgi:hypothetical protein